MKKARGKFYILPVFALFSAAAMMFVSWLIYAVFEENYKDIKQQYYAVVSGQTTQSIENSVKNGKTIESFYGMDTVLGDMLKLISTDEIPISTAITDMNGKILYRSYSSEDKKDRFDVLISGDDVKSAAAFSDEDAAYKAVTVRDYDLIIRPIYDEEHIQIGSMELFYHSDDISGELSEQKNNSLTATLMCIAVTVLVLLIYFIVLPDSLAGIGGNNGETETGKHKSRRNIFTFIIPVMAIMAGLAVQCVMSYNEYRERYRDVMFEGAAGISDYIGGVIGTLREKGVPYSKMNGLEEYLADKVNETPLLWNISVEDVFADTSDIIEHTNEYNICSNLEAADYGNVRISVEISKNYIDDKMTEMLLLFAVSLAVALIMIIELLKLPDILFAKLSGRLKDEKIKTTAAPIVRLGAFIAYTGMYVGIPFSSVLITQWNKSLFGLSVSFLSSVPMTAELLAIMACSLLLLPVYRRMNLRLVFILSAGISVTANALCFFANSPEQLILLRFFSGTGFAGIKYTLNSVVSGCSVNPNDITENLAAQNAGLLGGITCGGTLGGIIAGAVSVQSAYLIAALLLASFIAVMVGFAPWRSVCANMPVADKLAGKEKKPGMLSAVLNREMIGYMILIAVPMNFGLMFVSAFFPNFVTSKGLAGVTTSYGYLINGLVGIYLGPPVLRAFGKKFGKPACVFAALTLGAVSVFAMNISVPTAAALISVGLLGLFDGFGTPAASDYYVNMPTVRKIGANQGLSVLNVVGSIVQTLSPMLYSVILGSGIAGLNILGVFIAVCAVLFLAVSRVNERGGEKLQTNDK